MNNNIILSPIRLEDMELLINKAVANAISSLSKAPVQNDRCDFKGALKFVNEQGYPISESQFYKSTSLKEVPFKNFGRKLIFSRRELLAWIESKTIDKNDTAGIDLALAKSARKMKGAAKNA